MPTTYPNSYAGSAGINLTPQQQADNAAYLAGINRTLATTTPAVTTPTPNVPSTVAPTSGPGAELTTARTRYAASQTPEAQASARAASDAAAATARQQRIDAINLIYAPKIAETEQQNAGRSASTRARNIAAGLGGSEFADANKKETQKENDRRLEGVRAEQSLAIMNALDLIDKNQLEKQKFDNEMASKSYDERTKALNEIVENAKSSLKMLAAGGKTLTDIKRDPQSYQNIVNQTGWSDYEIDQFLHNNLPEKKDMKEYYKDNGDGTTEVTQTYFNQKTGKLEENKYNVSIPYSQFSKMDKYVGKDGSVSYYDPATDKLTTISGATTSATGTPIKGAPKGVTTTDIEKVRKTLLTIGAYEGFANPYLYRDAYDEWTSKGGDPKVFLSNFSPKTYINPVHNELKNADGSPVLPLYLQNTTKTPSTTLPTTTTASDFSI